MALTRQEPVQTVDALVERIRNLLHRFHPAECANPFHNAGYHLHCGSVLAGYLNGIIKKNIDVCQQIVLPG